MNRRLLLSLLALATVVAPQAHAEEPCAPQAGQVAAHDRLPPSTPVHELRSWNGRPHEPVVTVASAPANPRFPGRGYDPMGIKTKGAHPDTRFLIERQGRSRDVEISGCVEGECKLREVAKQAMVWKPLAEFQTPSTSNLNLETTHIETDPAKVAWPNSVVRVRGITRDGQELAPFYTKVQGLPTIQETRLNDQLNATRGIQLTGMLLPSARAWTHAGNLFVSQPAKNIKMIAEGEGTLKLAAEKETQKGELDAEFAKLNAERVASRPFDAARYNALSQQQIPTLVNEINALKQKGAALVAEGQRVTSNVISAAAVPGQSQVSTRNVRLATDAAAAGRLHTAASVADAESGYFGHRVEAIEQDLLETTVAFAPVAGQSVGSRRTVQFRVPHGDKAAFSMDGIEYFRVKPIAETQVNDPTL